MTAMRTQEEFLEELYDQHDYTDNAGDARTKAGRVYAEERAKAEAEIVELKEKLRQFTLAAHPVLNLPEGMVALVYDAVPELTAAKERIADLEVMLDVLALDFERAVEKKRNPNPGGMIVPWHHPLANSSGWAPSLVGYFEREAKTIRHMLAKGSK